MTSPTPSVSILVLTEDSGEHSHAVMEALCKKMLRLVEPACQTHRIKFEPANEDSRQLVNGNRWESRKKHRELVDLRKTIATKLCEKNGFVFFHVDGDCAWSRRASAPTPREFETRIQEPVRELLQADAVARKAPEIPRDANRLLQRLRILMPHYSVEAWLYQNIDVAITLCKSRHGGKDVKRFERWREHRHEIDELHQPKENVCLRDRHNKELAETAYPAQVVYQVGASFAVAVDSLGECEDLRSALRATCAA